MPNIPFGAVVLFGYSNKRMAESARFTPELPTTRNPVLAIAMEDIASHVGREACWTVSPLLLHSVVLPQDRDDAIARQAKDANAVRARHRLCRQHRVDDGFFCRLDRRPKERIDSVI